jgi:hypothetical protein
LVFVQKTNVHESLTLGNRSSYAVVARYSGFNL